VWKLDEMQEIRRITLDGPVQHLALSPDDKLLACSISGGEIHLWDIEQGKRLAKHQTDWGEPYVCFLSKKDIVQVIDGSLNKMLPNIWWLKVEGLNSFQSNQKAEDQL
jgi:WD40 repeat protein